MSEKLEETTPSPVSGTFSVIGDDRIIEMNPLQPFNTFEEAASWAESNRFAGTGGATVTEVLEPTDEARGLITLLAKSADSVGNSFRHRGLLKSSEGNFPNDKPFDEFFGRTGNAPYKAFTYDYKTNYSMISWYDYVFARVDAMKTMSAEERSNTIGLGLADVKKHAKGIEESSKKSEVSFQKMDAKNSLSYLIGLGDVRESKTEQAAKVIKKELLAIKDFDALFFFTYAPKLPCTSAQVERLQAGKTYVNNCWLARRGKDIYDNDIEEYAYGHELITTLPVWWINYVSARESMNNAMTPNMLSQAAKHWAPKTLKEWLNLGNAARSSSLSLVGLNSGLVQKLFSDLEKYISTVGGSSIAHSKNAEMALYMSIKLPTFRAFKGYLMHKAQQLGVAYQGTVADKNKFLKLMSPLVLHFIRCYRAFGVWMESVNMEMQPYTPTVQVIGIEDCLIGINKFSGSDIMDNTSNLNVCVAIIRKTWRHEFQVTRKAQTAYNKLKRESSDEPNSSFIEKVSEMYSEVTFDLEMTDEKAITYKTSDAVPMAL